MILNQSFLLKLPSLDLKFNLINIQKNVELDFTFFNYLVKYIKMKKKILFLSVANIVLVPLITISCKEKAIKKEPTDEEFKKIKEAFKKLTFKDTNIYKEKLNSNLENLKEYELEIFYRNFLYHDNLETLLSLINIRSDSDFWKSINKTEFDKKYKILSLAIDNRDKVNLTFQFTLLPNDSKYEYKGKTYNNYFYYFKKFDTISGFKYGDEITEKRNRDKKIINYISIGVSVTAILGLIIYIITRLIIKKKKGIKDVQVY